MQTIENHDEEYFKLQPKRALKALWKLLADPNDTAQVFTIIESLAGRSQLALYNRFLEDADGMRLLRERPQLLEKLGDRAYLESLPADSLGRAYLKFIDREGITPDGLVEASVEGQALTLDEESDAEYIRLRLRDTHDLWHAVTGYEGDVLGELALLAFSTAQTRNPGIDLIVIAGALRSRNLDVAKRALAAYRDGKRAAWLPAVVWEDLLDKPLAEVRRMLKIAPTAPYTRMRPDWTVDEGVIAAAA